MRLGALVSLGILFTAAACGSSNSPSATVAPDAGVDDAGTTTPSGDDDSTDAGAPDTKPDPHDGYPAAHPPIPVIDNFGGRLLTSAKVVTVTFAGMDSTLRDYVRDFDDKIGASAYWTTAMDGYDIGPTRSGGSYELTDTLSNVTTTDADLQTLLATQVASGALPPPDDDTVYMVYVPNAATITLADPAGTSCVEFAGYHSNGTMDLGGDAGSQRFVYAVITECAGTASGATAQNLMDEETETASHELAEAVTDPDINILGVAGGYYMMSNDAWASSRVGGEVGDLCENVAPVRAGSWAVTRLWNAKAAAASHAPCVPSASPVYYGAAPHTMIPFTKFGAGSHADGYVAAAKGKSADFEVDVFSSAPLSGPLTIVAGKRSGGHGTTFDPYTVAPVTKGVTLTLSQPTAVNGDKLTLHVAIDATTVSGTYAFSIRSVLSSTDYNSWPVLLYVP